MGSWLPLHLALAGGATTAIAGMMPFFSAAFATSQPVDARVRWLSVAAVALGALVVAVGYAGRNLGLGAVGGAVFLTGIALTAYATIVPVRRPLARRGGVVTLGYALALLLVAAGALLATLFLAGVTPVLQAWGNLRPAHAWLNLVGFVSLVIATTLLHFFPTVIGARILRIRSAYLTVLAASPAAPSWWPSASRPARLAHAGTAPWPSWSARSPWPSTRRRRGAPSQPGPATWAGIASPWAASSAPSPGSRWGP